MQFGRDVVHKCPTRGLPLDVHATLSRVAHPTVVGRRLLRRALRNLEIEQPRFGELPVVQPLVDTGCRDLTTRHGELVHCHAQSRRCPLEQQAACPRTRLAQIRAAGLDRHGTGGGALVGRSPGVCGLDVHTIGIDVEFLCDYCAQGCEQALADLHLAREGDHSTVVGQANPPTQGRERRQAGRQRVHEPANAVSARSTRGWLPQRHN